MGGLDLHRTKLFTGTFAHRRFSPLFKTSRGKGSYFFTKKTGRLLRLKTCGPPQAHGPRLLGPAEES